MVYESDVQPPAQVNNQGLMHLSPDDPIVVFTVKMRNLERLWLNSQKYLLEALELQDKMELMRAMTNDAFRSIQDLACAFLLDIRLRTIEPELLAKFTRVSKPLAKPLAGFTGVTGITLESPDCARELSAEFGYLKEIKGIYIKIRLIEREITIIGNKMQEIDIRSRETARLFNWLKNNS